MKSATAAALLDVAEREVQRLGYNGVSFRDLAAAVGIKNASVHYYFPNKGKLGAAIARRYTDRLVAELDRTAASSRDLAEAMAAYTDVFRKTLEQDGQMCLCGMLAAEIDSVPAEVRAEVVRFVNLNVEWLAGRLGSVPGATMSPDATRNRAKAIFSALEGAMLMARGTGDIADFDSIVLQFNQIGLLHG